MSTLKNLIKKYCPNGVEYVRLGDMCKITSGEFVNKSKQTTNGHYPVYNGGTCYTGFYDNYNTDSNKVIISARGASAGFINHIKEKFWAGNSCHVLNIFDNNLLTRYLYFILLKIVPLIISRRKEGTIPSLTKSSVENLKIPIPPLPVQEEIVKILDKFTDLENELENELRMRKMQFNAYRDKLLTFDNGVRFEKINTCYKLYSGMSEVSQKWKESGNCKFIDYKNIYNQLKIDVHDKPYANVKKLSQNIVKQYDILITAASEIPEECAITAVVEESIEDGIFLDDHAFGMHLIDNRVNSTFVNYYMQTQSFKNDVRKKVKGVTRFFISPSDIGALTIPVPPLEKQKEIVEKLDKFNEMCNEISDGLPLEIELRKKQYEFYSDKLLSFDKNGWVRVV